jgi:hypothetical protein
MNLWSKEQEKAFFTKYLNLGTPLGKLFYRTKDNNLFAYWPKGHKGERTTLQSRNTWIGKYSEEWCARLFEEIATSLGGYSVQEVISEEIGLTKDSPADVAICKTRETKQHPKNILLIIEVKISVTWNWECVPISEKSFNLVCIGDYKTHKGNPGFLRSDTMLKAIGKSTIIRATSLSSSKIPILIIGNTPVTKGYQKTVDNLKKYGIIQGFWSLNPKPLDKDDENIKNTPYKGFHRFDNYNELKSHAHILLRKDREFFSSRQSKNRLGEIIGLANRESSYEAKAQKFLEFLRQGEE